MCPDSGLLVGHTGPLPSADLGLADPLAQRLWRGDAQLGRQQPARRISMSYSPRCSAIRRTAGSGSALRYCCGMTITLLRKEVSSQLVHQGSGADLGECVPGGVMVPVLPCGRADIGAERPVRIGE